MSYRSDTHINLTNYQNDHGVVRMVMNIDCPFDEFVEVIKDMATPDWQTGMIDSYNAAVAGLDLGIRRTERIIPVEREV